MSKKDELLAALQIDREEPVAAPVRRPWVWLPVGAAILAVTAWLLAGPVATDPVPTDHPQTLEHTETAPVPVDTPEPRLPPRQPSNPDATLLDATGYVTARLEATVSSRITGRVKSILIEEGDVVSNGQLLAVLDDHLLRAELSLATRQVDAAKARVRELEVNRHQAELDLNRTIQLQHKQLASQADLDRARIKVQAIDAQLGVVASEIAVAESNQHLLAEHLKETEIRAPFAGVVVTKAAQPGEIVSPMSTGGFTRTGICSLVDMASLEILVDVSEANIRHVSAGQPVLISPNAYKEDKLKGEVITIIPVADRSRATIQVRIRLLEQDERILPDMAVRVAFMSNPTHQGEPYD